TGPKIQLLPGKPQDYADSQTGEQSEPDHHPYRFVQNGHELGYFVQLQNTLFSNRFFLRQLDPSSRIGSGVVAPLFCGLEYFGQEIAIMIRALPAQTALHFREHKSLNFERTDIRKASFAKSGD